MGKEFFPQRPASHPMIYVFTGNNPKYRGLLRVGSAEKKMEKQNQTILLDGSRWQA